METRQIKSFFQKTRSVAKKSTGGILWMLLVGLFVAVGCDKFKHNLEPEDTGILQIMDTGILQYLKTELGARVPQSGDSDTAIITISKDSINVFVGFGSRPCQWNPFETQVEIIDDVLYMRIIDSCPEPSGCYSRCPFPPYYTFDFVFKYQGKINQRYKIVFQIGLRPDNEGSIIIFSEGVINSKNS